MRHTRFIAAAAGVAFASTALVGCSSDDLDKAASDAADAAKEKGSEMASDAASKAGDAASDATGETGDDAGGEAGGAADVTVELGEFAGDASAGTAADFFTLRFEAATGASEVSALEPITTVDRYQGVQHYANHADVSAPFAVKVVGVEGDDVDVCIGPEATGARTLVLVDGKVAENRKGDHTC